MMRLSVVLCIPLVLGVGTEQKNRVKTQHASTQAKSCHWVFERNSWTAYDRLHVKKRMSTLIAQQHFTNHEVELAEVTPPSYFEQTATYSYFFGFHHYEDRSSKRDLLSEIRENVMKRVEEKKLERNANEVKRLVKKSQQLAAKAFKLGAKDAVRSPCPY
jgi:hypothetical protein